MAAFIHLCLAKDSGAPLIPCTSSVAVHKPNSTSTHESTDQLLLKFFKLSLPPEKKEISAPDQHSSSYKAQWDSIECWGSTVANIRLFG